MITLEEIQQPIADEVRHYKTFISEILHSDSNYVSSICKYILSNRGKQLRPLLVLLTAALHGKINRRSHLGASLVEMLHTASLLHDDVVDEALIRRGAPSVNALWRSRTAVLIGDYIFARTYHVCMQQGCDEMIAEATQSVHEMSEGELAQTELSDSLRMTRKIYLDIIYKKTASLLAACAAIGAISVSAAPDGIQAMRDFGTNLGIAFQIKDDILDYSPMEVTGKPMCSDMRERKITLPLLYVLENCSEAEHRKLIGKLSDIRQKPANADYLAQVVRERGGLEHAATVMSRYRKEALTSLEGYPPSPIRESLRHFANFILERDK